MTQRLSAILLLSLAIVLAGCTGGAADSPTTPAATDTPTPTTTPDPVTVDPTRSVLFTVTAESNVTVYGSVPLPDNDGVRIHYAGSSQTYPGVFSSDDLPADALDGATRVEPIRSGDSVSFAVSDGTGGGSVEWDSRPTSVFYSVVDSEDTILRWGTVDCDDTELSSVNLIVHETGTVSLAYECGASGAE